MSEKPIVLAAVLSILSGVPAQQYIETFTLPDGPAIPGWTAQTGSWQIKNQRAAPASGATFHYLTLDAFASLGACVLDVDAFHPGSLGTLNGGVCARHRGGSGNQGQVYAALQDNTNRGRLDFLWLGESLGGGNALNTGVNTHAGTVRMIVKGRTQTVVADQNFDGVFELTLTRSFTNAGSLDQGLVGLVGYGAVELDNFKLYDAILVQDPTASPKVGTTYKMTITAPLNNPGTGPVPTPWIVALSRGRDGTPLDGRRALPVNVDDLFLLSLSLGLSGILVIPGQDATAALPIPNDPGLVGLRVFACAVTVDGTRPYGIGAISNEHLFVLTQ